MIMTRSSIFSFTLCMRSHPHTQYTHTHIRTTSHTQPYTRTHALTLTQVASGDEIQDAMLFAHQMLAQLQANPAVNPLQDAMRKAQDLIEKQQQEQQQLQAGNAARSNPTGTTTRPTNNTTYDYINCANNMAHLGMLNPASAAAGPGSEPEAMQTLTAAHVSRLLVLFFTYTHTHTHTQHNGLARTVHIHCI
jgi:hypothetical protein